MSAKSTLLTPDEQWNRTVQYVDFLHNRRYMQLLRRWHEGTPRDGKAFSADEIRIFHLWEKEFESGPSRHNWLWLVKARHRFLGLGDVLMVTMSNGMCERYGMSGVSSKGVRLHYYHIPVRSSCGEVFQLPDDLIALRWDDPAIGRFVADFRASSRSRVGASIPAPKSIPVPAQGRAGLRFDGCYLSRSEPRHKRPTFHQRNCLRFFPDGTVIATSGLGNKMTQWVRRNFVIGPWDTSGRFKREGDSISFSIMLKGEVVERYEGRIDDNCLRLSRHCFRNWAQSRDDAVYRFSPWVE